MGTALMWLLRLLTYLTVGLSVLIGGLPLLFLGVFSAVCVDAFKLGVRLYQLFKEKFE